MLTVPDMFERRGYLLDVTRRRPLKRTLEMILDWLALYRYNEFFLFSETPLAEDALDLKRLEMYCEMQGLKLTLLTREAYENLFLSADYAIASTEADRSLAGRLEEMREGMLRAEVSGRARKAKGFLVTDFTDEGAWTPLVVSLPGLVMGGHFAAEGAKSARMDLERELDRVMEAPLGGLLLRLGTLYLRGGARHAHLSEYYEILSHDHGYSRSPGLTQGVLEDVSGVARGVRLAAERWLEKSAWAKEIVYAANLIETACHRRDESRLRALREEHGRIWRARFDDEGRVDSLFLLPRF